MKQKYVYWRDDGMWLGYSEEYPDYWTQGESEQELRDNFVDISNDLNLGRPPSGENESPLVT